MTKVLHGVVHGKTIELSEAPGVADGQEVEVVVKFSMPTRPWGEGIRASAGGWPTSGRMRTIEFWSKSGKTGNVRLGRRFRCEFPAGHQYLLRAPAATIRAEPPLHPTLGKVVHFTIVLDCTGYAWSVIARPERDCRRLRFGTMEATCSLATCRIVVSAADLMIASVALVHDFTLVTHNTADFQHIPGLRLETGSRRNRRPAVACLWTGRTGRRPVLLFR